MADVASKYESNQSWTPSTGTYYKTTEYKPFDSSASPRSIVVLKSDDPDAVLGAKPFGDFNGFYLIEEGVILSDEFKKNNNYSRDDNMQTAAFDSTKDHGRQLSSMNTDYTPDYVFINSRPYQLQHSIFKVDEVPSTCTVRGCQEHYEDEFAKCYNSDDNTDDMTEKQLEAIMLPLDYGNHNYDSTTGECMDCHKSFENGIGMITGNSLNVDASIGLNFYFKFDEDFYEENSSSWKDEDGTVHDQAYLRFTYADGSTETQPLNWAERVSTDDGSYQYKFQCPVNAKNMNSTITAELFYGDGTSTGVSQQYSVADYCNYILNEPEKWEESLVMLADAMLNYGSCAQTYFGVDTDKLYTPGEALINYLNDLKNKYSSEYDEEYVIDLSQLRPTVAFPHLPENARTVDEIGETEVRIDQAVIGSCTNGRISDLRAAAEILKGKKVAKGVRCIIIPGTQNVYLQAMHEGLFDIFIEAGAVVSTPTCGPCLGGHMGILAKGERAISTTNRNFVGRMGHVESEVYLASPAVAAASAVTGYITDPAKV